ncbi:MAG TPA: NUDIX hydrolase, partial [Burkholderiales bacterium]|nr:NUDIX hydrolase [Burkholderiales bacterium]
MFSGRLLHVHRDVVRLPDGHETVREYVRHPGAVMVVPLFEDGRVLLERQFRYPHRRDFIELPAGKLEPGEPHLETARRELLEETG